jgi:hypothetical protein
MKSDSSARFEGFWKILISSSLRLGIDCSETPRASLVARLVEGAIVNETPSRWAPK